MYILYGGGGGVNYDLGITVYVILSSMKIKIPIGPFSVNKASKKDHHKSDAYKKFERDVFLLLPIFNGYLFDGEVFINYVFYIKNYINSDVDNCIKCVQDILVKRGYILDDRYVKAIYAVKDRVENIKDESIIIDIVPYDKRHVFFTN